MLAIEIASHPTALHEKIKLLNGPTFLFQQVYWKVYLLIALSVKF